MFWLIEHQRGTQVKFKMANEKSDYRYFITSLQAQPESALETPWLQ